jgi:hypothetical protein
LVAEEMWTVVAVTEPLVAAGPNAVTQSPTARSVDAADCVALTGVELVVVTLRVSVLSGVGFVVLELLELLELLEVLELFELVDREKLPGEMSNPDTVRVVPSTAVTLPVAMENDANALRKLLEPDPPPGKDGGVPPPFRRKNPPPFVPAPPPNGNPRPGGTPFTVERAWPVHDPLEVGIVTVMLRAAIVVFEVFDAVPVTATQSPALSELTDSETVLENCVVAVQLTVVWPVMGFCTSMFELLSAATVPLAPESGFVGAAAPAVDANAAATTTAVAPVPRMRVHRRLVRRLLTVSMLLFPLSVSVRSCGAVCRESVWSLVAT